MVAGAEPSVREAVLRQLELLASLELQAKYERDVPAADVPAELVCGWFDDLDLPASASSVFVGKDLESVRAFSDSFEKARKDTQGLSLSELHSNPKWLKVAENARILLQQLCVAG
jgi:hypothetical protein